MQRQSGLCMHKVKELTDTQVALHEEPFGSCYCSTIVFLEQPANALRCPAAEFEPKKRACRFPRKTGFVRTDDLVHDFGLSLGRRGCHAGILIVPPDKVSTANSLAGLIA